MFCRDSKLLVMEKMRRQFCIGPYGRFAIRLLLRSAATDKLVPLLSTPCGTTGKDYCYDGCHWITY